MPSSSTRVQSKIYLLYLYLSTGSSQFFIGLSADSEGNCKSPNIANAIEFPLIHKVGNVDIFVLRKYQNMLDTDVGQFYKPLALADPRGRQGRAPPGVQILSCLCSFQSARPLRKILDPPLFIQCTMPNVNLHLNLFTGKSFQLISIRNCTKMSILPTLCITGKF